jgi:hypothetical protein
MYPSVLFASSEIKWLIHLTIYGTVDYQWLSASKTY